MNSLRWAVCLACLSMMATWPTSVLSGEQPELVTASLATFVVTHAGDSGAGSLRQAILDANGSPGADSIVFNIPGAGVHTIQPLTSLPSVTDPLTLDGSTQPGFAGSPLIELDGSLAGAGADGLWIVAGMTTVRALAINRFGAGGVGQRRPRSGIRISGPGGNLVVGNVVGLDPGASLLLPNTGSGVLIEDSGGNTVGGNTFDTRNVISGNLGAGIEIRGSTSTGNLIRGNLIGTAMDGVSGAGNGGPGVLLENAPGNTVAGLSTLRNIISANGEEGIRINGPFATGNLIQDNFIGTDITGTAPLGNQGDGVRIAASGNTVGGTTSSLRNTIAFNRGSGIAVLEGTGNALVRNSVVSNNSLGIDLGADGVTPNDPGDGDTGGNGLQNFPELLSVITDAGASTIEGVLHSSASTAFTLEFFGHSVCDPSGHGEGGQFFTSRTATTNGAGDASFLFVLPFPLPVGTFVTATATDPGSNTSEFSQCALVDDQTPAEVTNAMWANPTRLDWPAVPDADSYIVYRGRLGFLPNLQNSATESCLRFNGTGTTTGDILNETPGVGSILWWISTAVNSFGEGSAGSGSAGQRSLQSFGACSTCFHDMCDVGSPLASGCGACVTSICAAAPSCCTTSWDDACVARVLTTCGSLACEESASGCEHQQCVTGVPLTSGCDSPPVSPSCVMSICTVDSVCCSTVWDAFCVSETDDVCGFACN